jgi:hypothetical protein
MRASELRVVPICGCVLQHRPLKTVTSLRPSAVPTRRRRLHQSAGLRVGIHTCRHLRISQFHERKRVALIAGTPALLRPDERRS